MLHRRFILYLLLLVLLCVIIPPRQLPEGRAQELPKEEKSVADSIVIPLPVVHHAPPIYAPLSLPREDMHYDLSPSHPQPTYTPVEFYLPQWSIYRRSFTMWGITFSTGHASSGVPSGAEPTAEVLSFPLNSGH